MIVSTTLPSSRIGRTATMDTTSDRQAALTAVLSMNDILAKIETAPAGSRFQDERGIVFEVLKPGEIRFTIGGVSEIWVKN